MRRKSGFGGHAGMLAGMDDGLTRRLDAIERRLADLERRLPAGDAAQPTAGVGPPTVRADPVDLPVATPDLSPVASPHELPAAMPPLVMPTEKPAPRPPPLPTRRWPGTFDERGHPLDADDLPARPVLPLDTSHAAASLVPAPSAAPPHRETPVRAADAARPPIDFEQVLGLKWAGWIGAIVLVIGAGLGIKYAYDQGWLGGLPDEVRCLLIAVAGLGLIATGEIVYRRVNRVSATGLYGAGVAVLFLAAYAGQAWYGLYAPATALLLTIFAAAAGIALAARADLVSVAALAVLGAGLCPALFDTPTYRAAFFPVYLLCLQAMAIGLCAWRATPKWWTLRGLSLAVTTLWMLDDAARGSGRFDWAGAWVAAVMAGIYQAEWLYTMRRRAPDGAAGSRGGVVFSLLVTAALTAALMARCDDQTARTRGAVLIGLAGVVFALGRLGRRAAWRRPGRGFDLQGVLLLALAVPVTLKGPAMLFGWIALAAGLAGLAAMTRDRAAARAAAGVWLLAAVGTFGWADGRPEATHVWLHVGDEAVRAAVVVAAVLALVGHLTAYALHRLHPPPYRRGHVGVTAGLAVDVAAVVSLMAMLGEHASADFTTRSGVGYGLALLGAAFVPGLETLGAVSTGLLAVLAVKWAAFDVLRARLAPGWRPVGRPFWNAQAATGVVLAGAFGVAGWTHRRRAARFTDEAAARRGDAIWAAFFTVALVAVGFAASVEVDRAITLGRAAGRWAAWPGYSGHQLVWTILWAGCVAVGWLTLRVTVSTDVVRGNVSRCVRVLAYALVAKFVFVDVIGAAIVGPTPTPRAVLNLQNVAAAAVIGLLLAGGRATGTGGPGGLAVLGVLLVCGSAEIDRYARQQTDSPAWIVRQVGWSIYWASLAVLTLVVGFVWRRRPLRLAALGLLGVTLLKLTLVDLAGAGTGWRILSFLGLGVLLLATSVLYGKFRQRDGAGD